MRKLFHKKILQEKRDGVNRFSYVVFLNFISEYLCFSTKSTNNMKDKQLAHQGK